jgi:hypothetical protein
VHLHEIGKIKQVQVQRSSLKRGEPPHRSYDPVPLLVVARLVLTPHGAIGVAASGEEVMDIHLLTLLLSEQRSRDPERRNARDHSRA